VKILIVDDDPHILDIVSEILSVSGDNEVTKALGGPAAKEILLCSGQLFDCFLLDIQMPTIDGIELCKFIREQEVYSRTPILMLTAMSDKKHVDRSFAAGANDYISKPFDFQELLARIGTARRISEDAKKLQLLQQQIQEDVPYHEGLPKPGLSEALVLDDVANYLSVQTFENYTRQLNRGKFFSLSFLALQVVNIPEVYRRCTGIEFQHFVTDTADAIANTLNSNEAFFTYRGHGIYLVAFNRIRNSFCEEFAHDVQVGLNGMELRYRGGDPIYPLIRQSDIKNNGVFTKLGVLAAADAAVNDLHSQDKQPQFARFLRA